MTWLGLPGVPDDVLTGDGWAPCDGCPGPSNCAEGGDTCPIKHPALRTPAHQGSEERT